MRVLCLVLGALFLVARALYSTMEGLFPTTGALFPGAKMRLHIQFAWALARSFWTSN